MWTIIVLILNVSINADEVRVRARFTGNGGPFDGQSKLQQFTYPHPATVIGITEDLTDYAEKLKISIMLDDLEGETWEV